MSRAIIMVAVLALASAPFGLAQPRECNDTPVLFSDDTFRGRPLPLRDSVEDLHRIGMGDDASSICVPSGWRVTLYEDDDYGGDVLNLTGPVTITDLKRQRPEGQDWGDRISSVRVVRVRTSRYQGRLPADCDRYPVLFKNDGFRGGTARLDQSNPDLHRGGMGDDASSLCVPDGWRVILYEDTNYRGDRLELNGPDAIQDLKRDRPDGRDWGDRISSVQVERARGGFTRRPDESGGLYRDDPRDPRYETRGNCDDYVLLFEEYDYRGRYLQLDRDLPDLRNRGLGDTVSSVCIPAGWSATFYQYPDYRGRSFTISGHERIADLRRDRSRRDYWGDRIGSVQVRRSGYRDDRVPVTGPCRDFPVLYSDDDYRGRSLELVRSIRDLHRDGFGDTASSICVPDGWTVTLYEDTEFRGASVRLAPGQSIADLKRDGLRGQDWGDRVSSVEVRRGRNWR